MRPRQIVQDVFHLLIIQTFLRFFSRTTKAWKNLNVTVRAVAHDNNSIVSCFAI